MTDPGQPRDRDAPAHDPPAGDDPRPPLATDLPERTGGSRTGQPPKTAIERLLQSREAARLGREQYKANQHAKRARRMQIYLAVLSATGRKDLARREACDERGLPLHRDAIKQWRRLNIEGFRDRELEAERVAADNIEDLAVQRANQGSEKMIMFLLNGLRGDRYSYGRAPGQFAITDTRGVSAKSIAQELRTVWETLGDYCPPAKTNGSGEALPSGANGSGE